MSFASKHNKGAIDWEIDSKDFEYFSLKDLFEKDPENMVYVLRGLFINTKNNSEYGNSIVAILKDKFVNLPSHMEAEVKEILSSVEDVEDIKAGKVGFTIRPYESHKKQCYSVSWVDVPEK
jgi:hypothetical protein